MLRILRPLKSPVPRSFQVFPPLTLRRTPTASPLSSELELLNEPVPAQIVLPVAVPFLTTPFASRSTGLMASALTESDL
jgi:hypothetical protein